MRAHPQLLIPKRKSILYTKTPKNIFYNKSKNIKKIFKIILLISKRTSLQILSPPPLVTLENNAPKKKNQTTPSSPSSDYNGVKEAPTNGQKTFIKAL